MPFLRTPKGNKISFSPARLSSLLSLVYLEALGDRATRHRSDIQKHCLRIWSELESTFGKGEHDEWPGSGIQRAIDQELRAHANMEIHEAYVAMNINEFQDPVATQRQNIHPNSSTTPSSTAVDASQRSSATKTWNRFDAKPDNKKVLPLVDPEQIDPVWSILVRKTNDQQQLHHHDDDLKSVPEKLVSGRGLQNRADLAHGDAQVAHDGQAPHSIPSLDHWDRPLPNSLSERLGVVARIDAIKKKPLFEQHSVQVCRSHWISFWKSLSKRSFPWHVWERHILSIAPEQKHRSLPEWWTWWQNQIDTCLAMAPQVYELRRAVLERRKRAEITGQQWIDGSALAPQRPLRLEHTPTGQTWYQRLAVEHLKKIFAEHFSHIEWDWGSIQRALAPERDSLIDWKAWQHLDDAGALWGFAEDHVWMHGEKPSLEAKELPQWAWMRTAMAMAIYDPEPSMRNKNAIDLYHQISRMSLVPSAALVREAGKPMPRFFEDHTWDVPDHFGSIQKVIYSAAVDTTWTGTSASVWSKVRSKNAPVRSGRRKSTGVNDFLRTIDSHLKAQGRVGNDRPVTAMLPIWHLDVDEFMALRHENGQRLQPVVLVSDLFMQRVAENGTWTLFDPYVYPEALKGATGYTEAERQMATRKKQHPNAHKTVPAEKMWRKILTQARLGSPFLTFSDSDEAFSIANTPNNDVSLRGSGEAAQTQETYSSQRKTEENTAERMAVVHGLDGVGAFPMPNPPNGQKTHQPQCMQWPVVAININAMMSDQGEPLLVEWRETLTWAFWMAERMYEACASHLSAETLAVRPLCLGAVGFYEAIRKAMVGSGNDEGMLSTWIVKISEALATLTTVVDQVFCQKNGPAPIWNTNADVQAFHPQRCYARLKEKRRGGIGMPALPSEMSELFDQISAHRFSVRTVWAPFHQAATWAGVSPGGFGTLFPVEWVLDEDRVWRLTPTNFLLSEMKYIDDNSGFGQIFSHPEQPAKWPQAIRQMCAPDMAEWKIRLKHAALVRPWIDQGVSLTLPAGLPVGQLSLLLQQAWWMGLSNVRFEDPFRKPDLGSDLLNENRGDDHSEDLP